MKKLIVFSLIFLFFYLNLHMVIFKTINSNQKFQSQSLQQSLDQIIIILQINNPYMQVNGVKKEIDPGRGTVPVIVKGRTLVPIRAIIEEMGGTIEWNGNERKVIIKLKDTTIELWIDKKSARVNGTSKQLDVPPQIINGRTMLPLRFVTEELGCVVEWDGNTKTITINYKLEVPSEINKVSSEGEKIFTSSGGELALSDGTKLLVSPNAFSKETKVSLKSIINPLFSTVDTLGIEINGLKELKGELTLSVNGPKGLKNEELNIFGYDHEENKKIDFQYSYDSNSGLVSIKISPTILLNNNNKNYLFSNKVVESYSKVLGLKDKLSVYIGWTPYYSTKSNEKIIRMPYYEQIGGSCASTCAQMLLKFGGKDIKLFEILKTMNTPDNDFGLKAEVFSYNLRDYISKNLGYRVNSIPYYGIAHLKWRTLAQIDKGYPVILSWGDHAVLVLGYKSNGLEIIIHDPQNVSPSNNENGTMYTIRDWNWIRERHTRKLQIESYFILYPEGPFATSDCLSLMCPGGNEAYSMQGGEIAFYVDIKKRLSPLYFLQIKPSDKKNGYVWRFFGKDQELDFIPNDIEFLNFSLNAYNGSINKKEIKIDTIIYEDNDGYPGKRVVNNIQKFTINEAKLNEASYITYNYKYKPEDLIDYNISDKDGKQKILIYSSLQEELSVNDIFIRDSFIIKATLSILPKISSINPESGKGGDIITINGFMFGKNKSSKSKVIIGNKNVEIVSWNNREIKVKLPDNIESGPVVVYTGEKYEYESNKDIIFKSIISLKDPFEGNYIFTIGTVLYDCVNCKFVGGSGANIKINFKDGKIKHLEGQIWKVDGNYDKDGNIKINFSGIITFTDPLLPDYKYTITGILTGKFPNGFQFDSKNILSPKINGTVTQKTIYETEGCGKCPTRADHEYTYTIEKITTVP
ncbi:MAG: stalk domain-containing protein [Caldisericia bacterium]|nr:stalk domain-containing protein [Caldisericia bacterium]